MVTALNVLINSQNVFHAGPTRPVIHALIHIIPTIMDLAQLVAPDVILAILQLHASHVQIVIAKIVPQRAVWFANPNIILIQAVDAQNVDLIVKIVLRIQSAPIVPQGTLLISLELVKNKIQIAKNGVPLDALNALKSSL